MKIGDWVKISKVLFDNEFNTVNIVEVGQIINFLSVGKGKNVAEIKINDALVFKRVANLKKMTKNEFVLWKLEN